MQPESQQHAVVVAPTSGFGHLHPLLEVARRLATIPELQVTFLVGPDKLEALKQKSIPGVRLVPFEKELRLTNDQPAQELAEFISDLMPAPTLLLADTFVKCAGKVAEILGIPRVAIWAGNALSAMLMFYIPKLEQAGYLPLKGSSKENDIIDFLPGLQPIPATRLPLVIQEPGPYLPAFREALQDFVNADCILINTIEELEKQTVFKQRLLLNEHIYTIGPLTLQAPKAGNKSTEKSAPLFQWLDERKAASVLYIAFGSHVTLSVHQVEKIITALESCHQPFLWAMREDFIKDAPEGFYADSKVRLCSSGDGYVIDWAPQTDVLKHTSVGGFLTHSGWNSTLEALSAGVPTLCWPGGAEQNVNSFMISEHWKTGLEIANGPNVEEVTAEDIAKLITSLMKGETGEELRRRTLELKEVVLGSLKPDGSSCKNFEEFVSFMKLKSS